jgi:hypothetical protein
MDRRDALKSVALLMGGAISVTTMGVLFEGCNHIPDKAGSNTLFSADQQTMVTEIADLIIPTTDTPGAKAAGVGPFITMMIAECYPEKAQKIFVDGLEDVEKRSKNLFSKNFMALTAAQQIQILKALADETVKLKAEDKKKTDADVPKQLDAVNKAPKKKGDPYFFQMIRELTLLGYFSSEIGASKALVYVPVPGRYDGCVDLKPGQKAWAF